MLLRIVRFVLQKKASKKFFFLYIYDRFFKNSKLSTF